jgi:sugar/nucleoside kinase (ribokinase family)
MKTLPDGERVRMPVTDWQRWIRCGDTIQMNTAEFSVLTGNFINENNEAEKLLYHRKCRALVITRGIDGASLYRYDNGLLCEDYPSIKVNTFRDSTGCGDVFASAFFLMNLLNNHNYEESVQYAIAMAGRNASLGSVEELEKINEQ